MKGRMERAPVGHFLLEEPINLGFGVHLPVPALGIFHLSEQFILHSLAQRFG